METPRWTLIRLGERYGPMLGVLFGPGIEVLTLEEPWKDNQKKISCIPPGEYSFEPFLSLKHGNIIAVDGVPHRSLIRSHIGNDLDDTEGCILPGLRFGRLGGKVAVLQSTIALKRMLLEVRKGDRIKILAPQLPIIA